MAGARTRERAASCECVWPGRGEGVRGELVRMIGEDLMVDIGIISAREVDGKEFAVVGVILYLQMLTSVDIGLGAKYSLKFFLTADS